MNNTSSAAGKPYTEIYGVPVFQNGEGQNVYNVCAHKGTKYVEINGKAIPDHNNNFKEDHLPESRLIRPTRVKQIK